MCLNNNMTSGVEILKIFLKIIIPLRDQDAKKTANTLKIFLRHAAEKPEAVLEGCAQKSACD